jgi:hypothetical protein
VVFPATGPEAGSTFWMTGSLTVADTLILASTSTDRKAPDWMITTPTRITSQTSSFSQRPVILRNFPDFSIKETACY